MRLSHRLIRASRSLTRSPNGLLRRHIEAVNLSPPASIRLLPADIGEVLRGMPDVVDGEDDDDKARLEDVEIPLVRVQIAVEASRELDHAVDGAQEDHGRAGVDGPQHAGPARIGPFLAEAARHDVEAEGDQEEEAEGGNLNSQPYLEYPEAGLNG